MKYTKFVGLDVHKETITVAVAKEGREAAESLGTIINNPEAIAKLVRKLGPAKNLYFCCEAGLSESSSAGNRYQGRTTKKVYRFCSPQG